MLGRSGDVAEAAALCSQAIEQMESRGERCFEAELRRLHGSLWLSAGEPEKAKASLEKAIHVARRQEATSLEFRAALNLGHLFEDEGRFADSQELLAGVRRRITEGVGSCDLKEARTACLASHVPAPQSSLAAGPV
jgi:adenylate cyclase